VSRGPSTVSSQSLRSWLGFAQDDKGLGSTFSVQFSYSSVQFLVLGFGLL